MEQASTADSSPAAVVASGCAVRLSFTLSASSKCSRAHVAAAARSAGVNPDGEVGAPASLGGAIERTTA